MCGWEGGGEGGAEWKIKSKEGLGLVSVVGVSVSRQGESDASQDKCNEL